MPCLICNRDAKNAEFCKLHERAYQNLTQGYEQWMKALTISWKDYLEAVAKNPNTGLWVKEIAEHLLKEGAHK